MFDKRAIHVHQPRRERGLFVLAAVAVLALVVGLAVPAGAQDVDELEAERDEVQRMVDEADAELDDVRARIDTLHDRIAEATRRMEVLDQEVATLEARATTARDQLFELQEVVDQGEDAMRRRARALYMQGPGDPIIEFMTSDDVAEGIDRASMLDRLTRDDQQRVEDATVDRAELEAAVEELHLLQGALTDVRREQQQIHDDQAADLQEAERLRDEVKSRVGELTAREEAITADIEAARKAQREREAARKAAAEAAAAAAEAEAEAAASSGASSGSGGSSGSSGSVSSAGRACPMNSIPQLFDDWGWPRGGGTRSHQGNDLYGDFREPVFAIASGVWDIRPYGSSAGNWGVLKGDDGNHYYYMHLDGHAVGDGARVSAGQQVAYNGWTGNAVGSVYHIHFEIHPGGGGPVDPYPYLAPIC